MYTCWYTNIALEILQEIAAYSICFEPIGLILEVSEVGRKPPRKRTKVTQEGGALKKEI